MTPPRILALFVCLLLGAPAAASAQALDASQKARFHFGPVALTPKLAIENLGVDTNVFNSPVVPFKDFTAVVTPGADVWLHAGRALLTSKTGVGLVYYHKAASQRSVDLNEDVRLDVDLTRAVPRFTAVFLHTRQRPNDEIDTRVQQKEVGAGAGVTVPIGSRFWFDLDGSRARYDYSQGAYGDPEVAEALNRDSTNVTLAGRMELTPLTSLAVKADTIQDRFVFRPERDSDSLRVLPGLVFQPFAPISGKAFVGFRHFNALSAAVADYTGVVADVELKYVARDVFRVTGTVKRDVDYSLDLNEAYYVDTSFGAEAMQAVGLYWDVVGRIRRAALAYQETATGIPGRVDHVLVWGGGIGRRLGEDLRVGFDVDYVQRTSVLPSRAYNGFRFGGSFIYGY